MNSIAVIISRDDYSNDLFQAMRAEIGGHVDAILLTPKKDAMIDINPPRDIDADFAIQTAKTILARFGIEQFKIEKWQ